MSCGERFIAGEGRIHDHQDDINFPHDRQHEDVLMDEMPGTVTLWPWPLYFFAEAASPWTSWPPRPHR
jgi:hypothetical protein